MSDNATSVLLPKHSLAVTTDNQQGSRPKFGIDPSETTRRPPHEAKIIKAYLQGALHDGTFSKNKRFRISQKGTDWLKVLKALFESIGYTSWIYREGRLRDVYVIETLADFLDFKFNPLKVCTDEEKIGYVRGFFDAEGGIPHNKNSRFYIQLVQKDWNKINQLKQVLENLGIIAGKIHNPSKRVDPNYWRIFILAKSQKDFIRLINSWHPKKRNILAERVMI